MPFAAVDLSRVKTYPLERRENRVALEDLITPATPCPPFDYPELAEVAGRVAAARSAGRPVILMFGGHLIKRGLAPLVIDLLEKGVVTHLASNGAATIHDFEIALLGHTSEDVAKSLADGSFGMAEETGAWMNAAIQAGAAEGLGLGEALGRMIAADARFGCRQHSLLYSAYRLGIPYTVHVALGTDIIHQHPAVDFAALGWASGQDFKIFAQAVCGLEGGVFLNFGSAVIGPEVFLKALSIARNLGNTVRVFTTANFDLMPLRDYRAPIDDNHPDYYYRPRKNIVNRPVLLGGRGYHITGDHIATLPNLYRLVMEQHTPQAAVSQNTAPTAPVVPAAPQAVVPVEESFPDDSVATRSELESPAQDRQPALSRQRLEDLLAGIRQQRVGVIGDFTLDGYWHADMERSELSRETPLYPRPVVREAYSPGGAANVAWNLARLQTGAVRAFSVLGGDWRGALLRALLGDEGIRIDTLLTQPERITPFYGKILLQAPGRAAQEDARLDFVNTHPLSVAIEQALLDGLACSLPELDALIVADYQQQGVLTTAVIDGLLQLARQNPRLPVLVDSRSRPAAYHGLILKPNEIEAARLFFPGRDPGAVALEQLTQAALQHHLSTGRPIFITRGAQGCLVCAGGRAQTAPGVPAAPPIDPVGAGDAFIAALAAALAAGAAPLEAAFFANLCASVTVTKLGVTGTASPAEVLAQYDQWIEQRAAP